MFSYIFCYGVIWGNVVCNNWVLFLVSVIILKVYYCIIDCEVFCYFNDVRGVVIKWCVVVDVKYCYINCCCVW